MDPLPGCAVGGAGASPSPPPAAPPPPPAAPPPAAAPLPACARRLSALGAFCMAHHMPLGLLVMVVLGFVWPAPGLAAGATPLASLCLVGIFLIAGVNLAPGAATAVARSRLPLGVGLASILLASPAASLALARLPLAPPAFATGLAIFVAMPTTSSTGVLIVGEARGSVPLALALSVVSNVAAVFTAPLFVSGILAVAADGGAGAGGGLALDAWPLLVRLALTVLLPLAVGVAARRTLPPVAAAAARHRMALKLASSAMLIAVPWVLMSSSAAALRATPAGDVAALAGVAVLVHLALLAANAAAAAVLPATVPAGDRTAVVVMGAQKTINLAAAVLLALPPDAGADAGLLMLPCIVGHFSQTVIDAALASWGRGRAAAAPIAEAAAPPPPPPLLLPPGLARPIPDAAVAAAPLPAFAPASAARTTHEERRSLAVADAAVAAEPLTAASGNEP